MPKPQNLRRGSWYASKRDRLVRRILAGASCMGCSCGEVVIVPYERGMVSGLFASWWSRRDRLERARLAFRNRSIG